MLLPPQLINYIQRQQQGQQALKPKNGECQTSTRIKRRGAAYNGSTANAGAPDLDAQIAERQRCTAERRHLWAPLKSLRAPTLKLLLLLLLLLKGKLLLKLLLWWLLLLSLCVSSFVLSWFSLGRVVVSVVSLSSLWRCG